MKPLKQFTGTIHAWSRALGIEPKTLTQRLTKAEIHTTPGAEITARQVMKAMTGDDRAEKTALIRAKRIAQETENREREGELVEMAVAEKAIWHDTVLPLKREIETMPDSVCALVNPENPALAHSVLTGWAEQFFVRIGNATEQLHQTSKKEIK